RRRSGVAGVLIEGCPAVTSGDSLWTTHVAAPIVALVPNESRQVVDVLTAEGRLYSLGNQQLAARHMDEAKFSSRKSGVEIFDEAANSTDGQTVVWTETGVGGRGYGYGAGSGAEPVSMSLPTTPAAAAVPLGGGVIAPLTNGAVALV